MQLIERWSKDYEFAEPQWINMLNFVEYLNEKGKIRDSSIGCLKNSLPKGGVTKPAGYEFPEERRSRIAKESMAARQKALDELKTLRLQEQALADKDSVTSAIEDIKSTDKVLGTKLVMAIKLFEKSGRITTQLETRLKRWMRWE